MIDSIVDCKNKAFYVPPSLNEIYYTKSVTKDNPCQIGFIDI